MRFACALVAASMAAPIYAGISNGTIKVTVDGKDTEIHVVSADWSKEFVSVKDNGFSLNGGGRIYFATRDADKFERDMFWQAPLLGKHFSYNINVNNVGCHCNAAAYFIKMPEGSDGDFYCDAQVNGSPLCPEYDTWEGNKYTMASTTHTCNGSPGNWNWCDGGGCQTNAWNVD